MKEDRITKAKVRSDFAYMRELMRRADEMMRQADIDCSLGSDFEQLSLELIGSAHTLNAYLEQRMMEGK